MTDYNASQSLLILSIIMFIQFHMFGVSQASTQTEVLPRPNLNITNLQQRPILQPETNDRDLPAANNPDVENQDGSHIEAGTQPAAEETSSSVVASPTIMCYANTRVSAGDAVLNLITYNTASATTGGELDLSFNTHELILQGDIFNRLAFGGETAGIAANYLAGMRYHNANNMLGVSSAVSEINLTGMLHYLLSQLGLLQAHSLLGTARLQTSISQVGTHMTLRELRLWNNRENTLFRPTIISLALWAGQLAGGLLGGLLGLPFWMPGLGASLGGAVSGYATSRLISCFVPPDSIVRSLRPSTLNFNVPQISISSRTLFSEDVNRDAEYLANAELPGTALSVFQAQNNAIASLIESTASIGLRAVNEVRLPSYIQRDRDSPPDPSEPSDRRRPRFEAPELFYTPSVDAVPEGAESIAHYVDNTDLLET